MNTDQTYITVAETAKRLRKSVSTIWRWTVKKKDEGFPQPIKHSPSSVVFDFNELLEWEKNRRLARP